MFQLERCDRLNRLFQLERCAGLKRLFQLGQCAGLKRRSPPQAATFATRLSPAHRSGRSCLPVLNQLLFDLLQRRRVINRGQVTGIAVFAYRLYGATQQLAAACFGQQAEEQDA